MIIADKIISLRKKNGWSQEELAEKLNVSRQSVSKWESTASIPDINRILEMAKLFGVTTDYLLKDELETEEFLETDGDDTTKRVTLHEANAYMDEMRYQGKKIGLGVLLCILGPIILILLAGLSEESDFAITEDQAGGFGTVILLILVAIGVITFIMCGMRIKRFEYLKQGDFRLEYGVSGIVKERAQAFEGIYRNGIIIGVVLCVLSPAPLLTAAALGVQKDMTYIMMTILLLVIVAVAVYIFVNVCMVKESFDLLLKEGEFNPREKKANETVNKLSSMYWPLMAAVYLLWSFLSNDWSISWVIWPVAALVFVALSAALRKLDK